MIKSSGTIEIVGKRMLHAFLANGTKNETQQYIEHCIVDSSANPSTGRFECFLDSFDTKRKEQFNKKLQGTQEKMDLNALVNLRNDIAHGRNISVSISIVKRYYESGVKVLNVLESIL